VEIVFDIETIPAGEKMTKEGFTPPGTMSKPETIALWYQDKVPELIEKEYLDRAKSTYRSQVICLAYKIDESEIGVLWGDERDIILQFEKVLDPYRNKIDGATWIGHNIISFDLPILRQRGFKYDISLFKRINLKKYDDRVFDTMERFFRPEKDYISLDELCKFLGMEGKSFDASKIYERYKAGDIQGICEDCKNDVQVEWNVYQRMQ